MIASRTCSPVAATGASVSTLPEVSWVSVGLSQQKHCPVGLLFFCQKSAELCGISQTDRKNSLRIRIESSRMAYLFLFYDSAELRHHVV